MITNAVRNFTIDGAHTRVGFSVRHLMIAKVRGHFNEVSGNIIAASDTMMPYSVDVRVEAGSIDTSSPQRDAHLRSPDFLDMERFPILAFHSSSVTGTLSQFEINGELTIRGVMRPLLLKGGFEGRVKDSNGKDRVGYEAFGTVSRKDFGLMWNPRTETGAVVVGDEIRIEIDVEAVAEQ